MNPSIVTDAVRAYIGRESTIELACDAVERGAIRRYVHAIMDDDPRFAGGEVAPILFPTHMFRRGFGTQDPIQANAANADFDGVADGVGATATQGLPDIEPLKHLRLMNGGSELELIRHARAGERVTVRSRYADITERSTSKGPMALVTIESEFRTEAGELLLRLRTTLIRI